MYDTLQFDINLKHFMKTKLPCPIFLIHCKSVLGHKIIHFDISNAKMFLTTIEINDIITSYAFYTFENCNYDFNMSNKNIAQPSTFLNFQFINQFPYVLFQKSFNVL